MYQAIFIERGEQWGQDTVHLWDDTLGHRIIPFRDFDYAYEPNRTGKYVSMTNVRLSKIKRFKKDDPTLFESDLPQETRVLTDLYLNEDTPSEGHRVMFFDIEVSMENGVPKTEHPNNEITSIAYLDALTNEYNVLVLDKGGHYTNQVKNGEYVAIVNEIPKTVKYTANLHFYQNETDLLYAFLDQYEAINPTILSGWNSDQFDIPYLYNRIKQQCGTNTAGRLSSIGKVKYSKFRDRYQIAGVSSLDYMMLYKKFTYTQLANYRLDTVGRLEVGMGKLEYDGSLDELFAKNLDKFIEYNLRDVFIITELDAKLKFIELVRGICHMGHVSYEDYWYSSKFLEGAIITYLHRKGIIATNRPQGGRELMASQKEEGVQGFAGAYVKAPIPGFYEWVYSLDLQSLYPSIIMSLNISPETKIGYVTNWNADKHINDTMEDYLIRGTTETAPVRLNRETFIKYMKTENFMVSSNGVLYNGSTQGIIPEILDNWFSIRVEYNALKKKYREEGDAEQEEYYDRRQHIQKILLNSLYGVLGLPIFRFFDIDNALAVTASGQAVIKRSEAFVNAMYWSKMGGENDHCTYIDTDSLYFSSAPLLPDNADPKEFTIKLARVVAKKLNDYYGELAQNLFFCDKHRLFIKGEAVASTAVWIAKKRYTMLKVYDLEASRDIDSKMDITGLDVVRSSFPPAFRDFMSEIMKDILDKVPKEDVDSKVLTFRDKLNAMPYLDIARNTTANNISEYMSGEGLNMFVKGAPAHVKAALTYNAMLKRLNLDKLYAPITDGEKIKYVYLKKNPYNLETIAVRGYDDPKEIVQLITDYLDYASLFEKELQTKIEDFYSALRWGAIPTEINQNAKDWFSF